MLWRDRLFAALIAITVTAALSAAVIRLAPEKPRISPTQIENGVTYTATGVAHDAIVARVEENGAEAELLTYEIGYSCSYLDYMLQSYSGTELDLDGVLPGGETARDYIKEESLRMVKQQLVLENLAARCGVTLSAETETQLAAERADNVAQLGEEGYLEEIYKLGLSEAGYDRVTRANHLYQALYESYCTPGSALYADEDVLHAYAAGVGYITADHILIPTIDLATREALSEETVAANRALAEDLLAQLRASEDPIALFKELADRYSEDTGRATNPDGYTFTTGTMVEEFDSAARALGENEISDVVESAYGYHIILRKPLDVQTAIEAVREEYFDVLFLAEVDGAELERSPALDSFDVEAVYATLQAAQGAASEAEEGQG